MINSINWSQIDSFDEEIVKANANLYVRVITLKKNWTKLILTANDPFYTEEVINSLHFQNVAKVIFKDKTAEEIIQQLDVAQVNVRYQLLLILVENFDKLPVVVEVGKILAKTVSERPWVLNERVIFALQPIEVLKAILLSSENFNDLNIERWQNILDPTKTTKSGAFNLSIFNNPREWLPRKSFGEAIVDIYIDY